LEYISAELDHLSIDTVVRWDLIRDEGFESRLEVLDAHQAVVDFVDDRDELLLLVGYLRLVVETGAVPVSPGLLLALDHEVAQVFPGLVAKSLHHLHLLDQSSVLLDQHPLREFDDVLVHSAFDLVLDDAVVESPSVELLILGHGFSELLL